jgi:hypothetical protein
MKKVTGKKLSTLSNEARALRQRLIREYEIEDSGGLLLLETAMEAFSRMREAQALVAQHGALVKDRFGQLQKNPAIVVERDSRAAMLAALRALNLDLEPLHPRTGRPSAESTLGANDDAD